jgi:hypothetical protein
MLAIDFPLLIFVFGNFDAVVKFWPNFATNKQRGPGLETEKFGYELSIYILPV